ncbi:hypothetical protein N7499_003707 [Penicillium canescens]|nr:hypothetical protein N7522_001854 [Penicillium canescens]KAJ6066385.1 hypothetical protein N7444_000138 [Penicillium canescens]KAJ6090993.1 hypothetical protein N7499_003707 [Penicillium canescens]
MHRRFLVDIGSVPVGYKLKKGCSAPGIPIIKEFMLWYYAQFTKECHQANGRAMVIATLSSAERFFSSFEASTGNKVAAADRSEVYRQVAKVDDAGRGLLFIVDQIGSNGP